MIKYMLYYTLLSLIIIIGQFVQPAACHAKSPGYSTSRLPGSESQEKARAHISKHRYKKKKVQFNRLKSATVRSHKSRVNALRNKLSKQDATDIEKQTTRDYLRRENAQLKKKLRKINKLNPSSSYAKPKRSHTLNSRNLKSKRRLKAPMTNFKNSHRSHIHKTAAIKPRTIEHTPSRAVHINIASKPASTSQGDSSTTQLNIAQTTHPTGVTSATALNAPNMPHTVANIACPIDED